MGLLTEAECGDDQSLSERKNYLLELDDGHVNLVLERFQSLSRTTAKRSMTVGLII